MSKKGIDLLLAKVNEVAFIAGELTGSGEIDLGARDLEEASDIYEEIYDEWILAGRGVLDTDVVYSESLIHSEEECNYITAYAKRRLNEKFGVNSIKEV